MMSNLLTMSEREMVHYLDMYSEDPVIHRLLGMITYTRDEYQYLVENLADAGMDQDFLVFHGMTSPGSYIKELEFQVEELEREKSSLEEELDELKTKTVVEFIAEVRQEQLELKQQMYIVKNDNGILQRRAEELQAKLDMWGVMSRPEVSNV